MVAFSCMNRVASLRKGLCPIHQRSDRALVWRCDSDRVKQSWRQSLLEYEAEALYTAAYALEDSAVLSDRPVPTPLY
jgi:hypothetical protein